MINLCLQKEPENRVANGSFLSKNRNIENLIYQLDHGIPPSDFCFSDNIVGVVQAVNAKLLQENEKIAEKSRELEIKKTELVDEKKAHEKTRQELQQIKSANIYTLAGQLNGLGMFLSIKIKVKQKDFYFDDDKYETRKPIMKSTEKESFSIRSIFHAVDLGLRRINLKVGEN